MAKLNETEQRFHIYDPIRPDSAHLYFSLRRHCCRRFLSRNLPAEN